MPFRDVIGHRRLTGVLARSVKAGTLPPSLILGGPAGVGKRCVALALAQAMNCAAPVSAEQRITHDGLHPGFDIDACGECAACRRIARGVHPDVIAIEPGDSGAIKVDAIRDVIERTGYRPFEGRRRVVLIDDADALVVGAQNALLKTLEEPPSGSVFLLITARPDALLATVRSRCPLLRFGPLSEDEVTAALVAGGKSEVEARAAAVVAAGSIGQALAVEAGDLLEARTVAGRVLTRAASAPDPKRRLEVAKDLLEKTGAGGAGDREQLAAHLRAMSALLRDVALLSTRARAVSLAHPDIEADIARLTGYAGERGLRAFAAIERALDALGRNASPKIVADWLVLQL